MHFLYATLVCYQVPRGLQHEHNLDQDCSAYVPIKMRKLVQCYLDDPDMRVSSYRIWGSLAVSQKVDLADYPATKKNKEQVSLPSVCMLRSRPTHFLYLAPCSPSPFTYAGSPLHSQRKKIERRRLHGEHVCGSGSVQGRQPRHGRTILGLR